MSTEAGWGKGSHGRNGFCSSGHTEPWSGSEQTGQGELEVMDEDLEVLDWYFRMVPGWFRPSRSRRWHATHILIFSSFVLPGWHSRGSKGGSKKNKGGGKQTRGARRGMETLTEHDGKPDCLFL